MQERRFASQSQTFSTLIENRRIYVDKTEYVYKMTHELDRVFLSRPRRFGKSLLCSTLRSYFEGKKELFEGLAIEKLETEWVKYPVLHFDMSGAKNLDGEKLEDYLSALLEGYETKYNIIRSSPNSNVRLKKIIEEACAQENQKVVIIIDEYDAPLLEVVHEEKNLGVVRKVMRNFYSPLKACDDYIHFLFLTGITKFSQLSIFSELNSLRNISMKPQYAAICGITEEEMLTQLSVYIDDMAENLGETREETIIGLKKKYDGYHFAWPSPDIYNPYSLINALSDLTRESFWFETGTPIYVIEMLRKFKVLPANIGGVKVYAEDFDAPTNQIENIVPLLYQSGYITIKKCAGKRYILDIPNEEVHDGLMKSLLPYYVTPELKIEAKNVLGDMSDMIDADDMDGALKMLQKFLLKVPYPDFITKEKGESDEEAKRRKITDYEGYYQQMMYVIFSMLGCWRVGHEEGMATGSIDLTLETGTRIYVIEIKVNKSGDVAVGQIDGRKYVAKYSLEPLPVYKLGVNFDTEARTISDWVLELA